MFTVVMGDHIELSPRGWVREQTEQILGRGTTDGVEVFDRPIVLLTVTGAKSGKRRYVPLMRVEKDGRYVIVASTVAPRASRVVRQRQGEPDGDAARRRQGRHAHGSRTRGARARRVVAAGR